MYNIKRKFIRMDKKEGMTHKQRITHVRIIVELIGQKKRHFIGVSEPHKCSQLFLPGGHVERGQSAQNAALIELYQETGITLSKGCHLHKFGTPMRGNHGGCVLYYWVQIRRKDLGLLKPQSGDEVKGVKILLPHELQKMIKSHRKHLLKYINQVPVGACFIFCGTGENRTPVHICSILDSTCVEYLAFSARRKYCADNL